jgi:probable DNA metabolism protein
VIEMDYLYDGTYEGLLCCLYCHFLKIPATGIYQKHIYQRHLINPYREVPSLEKYSDYMDQKLKQHLGELISSQIFQCFLYEKGETENIILRFVDLCFKKGAKYAGFHTHPIVSSFDEAVRKVKYETHRYVGYVRFIQMGEYLYSSIHPQYNILPLIGGHFSDRYKGEKIIIHDVERKIALAANDGNFLVIPFDKTDLSKYAKNNFFEILWKTYFDHIAIKDRINPKLQRNFVPLKYRKDLTEFK